MTQREWGAYFLSTTRAACLVVVALGAASAARAQSTVTYTYDALGRLIAVQDGKAAGQVVGVSYTYDSAGNRRSVVVTGAASGGANDGDANGGSTARRLVVVPLNGFTVVVLP